MLYMISTSLAINYLKSGISIIKLQTNAGLLLYQDGVYLALKNTNHAKQLTKLAKTHPIYLLEDDVKARGITEQLLQFTNYINYEQFVKLTMQHQKIISW